jgi:hypothetical protein
MQNKIGEEFRNRVARLEHSFPGAYRFLKRLEIEGEKHELWISTASNTHVYKRNAFLAYVRLRSSETKPPSLELRPEFNQQIHRDTPDRSALVFPTLVERLATELGGWKDGWIHKLKGAAYEVDVRAPDRFFEELFDRLGAVDVEQRG